MSIPHENIPMQAAPGWRFWAGIFIAVVLMTFVGLFGVAIAG